jgi:hypothetical protein
MPSHETSRIRRIQVFSRKSRHVDTSESAELQTVLLAQNVLINQLTGNVSFIEVFSSFRLPRLPFEAHFFCIAQLVNIFRNARLQIDIRDPEDEPFWSAQMMLESPPIPGATVYAVLAVGPKALVKPGELVVSISIDGDLAGRFTYPVLSIETDSNPADIQEVR